MTRTHKFALIFVCCWLSAAANAESKITGETVIKGYRALMSPSEFAEVSQSHGPKDNPELNEYVFVGCKITWVQWKIEDAQQWGGKATDEELAEYREMGCRELAAGPSSLTVGGIPVKTVSQYQAKPDSEVKGEYDLDNTITFVFDGRYHAELARILQIRFGEPYYNSDPDNRRVSWFSWSLVSAEMPLDEWKRNIGARLDLHYLEGIEGLSPDTSFLSLRHRDPIRERAFKRKQEEDF